MEEMRQAIARRQGESTPRGRPRSVIEASVPSPPRLDHNMQSLLAEAEKDLMQASSNQQALQNVLKSLEGSFKMVSYINITFNLI